MVRQGGKQEKVSLPFLFLLGTAHNNNNNNNKHSVLYSSLPRENSQKRHGELRQRK